MRFLCPDELRVDVNNISTESVAMEKQHCDLFSAVEQFYVAVNSINVIQSPSKTSDTLFQFQPNMDYLTQILI
jgi:hypothetical protein